MICLFCQQSLTMNDSKDGALFCNNCYFHPDLELINSRVFIFDFYESGCYGYSLVFCHNQEEYLISSSKKYLDISLWKGGNILRLSPIAYQDLTVFKLETIINFI